MEIKIEIRNNYGQDMAYPACSTARKFAAIAGTKTLTAEVITYIKAIGFQITIQQQSTDELLGGLR